MYQCVYWNNELFHINLTISTRWTILIRYRIVSRRIVFTIEFVSIVNRVGLTILKEKKQWSREPFKHLQLSFKNTIYSSYTVFFLTPISLVIKINFKVPIYRYVHFDNIIYIYICRCMSFFFLQDSTSF